MYANNNGTCVNEKSLDVQQQRDGFSCGPFWLAFATSPVHGKNPRKLLSADKLMKKHIEEFFFNF